jgi:AraC-like DNA-binding protein
MSEIAEQVGYSDASNFRRAFRQATGMNLKEYRRAPLSLPPVGGRGG